LPRLSAVEGDRRRGYRGDATRNDREEVFVFEPVAPGLARLGIVFVNVYALGEPEGRWVLVDAGLKGSEGLILRSAARLFGAGARPEAIVLTHGHFDHVGSARRLADAWGVPLYAHPLELPYLTGLSDFPPRDPTMGGAMAHMSRLMPDHGYDFGGRVLPLPTDGGVPGAPGWLWLHTPGHTSGHVSLMHESNGVLLAGDALATMDLDSWSAYLTRRRAFNRPSPPFTSDWAATRDSIERLAWLEPAVVAAGHGLPVSGEGVAEELRRFVEGFTPPGRGRYVGNPPSAGEKGIEWLPPPVPDPYARGVMAGTAMGAGALLLASARRRRRVS
jgi:glyoxylase-like metal-dependent hydrolase (beta-lactamase superfamily II)